MGKFFVCILTILKEQWDSTSILLKDTSACNPIDGDRTANLLVSTYPQSPG